MGLNGLGIVPVSPISYGFAVELTFPKPEHVSNGLIVFLSKIYSGAIGLLTGYLSEYHDPKYAILVFIIINKPGCPDHRLLLHGISMLEDEGGSVKFRVPLWHYSRVVPTILTKWRHCCRLT
jgi:hypothetical protein